MAYRNYGVANGAVVAQDGTGDFLTLTAAVAALSPLGSYINLAPGTYNENLTIFGYYTISAMPGSEGSVGGGDAGVYFNGKITLTNNGTVSFSSIYFNNAIDYVLSSTGTGFMTINCNNCYFSALGHTPILINNSQSDLNIRNCSADVGTIGNTFGVFTATLGVRIQGSSITNSAGSTTATNIASGGLIIDNCVVQIPLSSSGSGYVSISNSNQNTSAINSIAYTHNSSDTTNSSILNNVINSGSASAISVISGSSKVAGNTITSSNTNAITGAGTVVLGDNDFLNSQIINTSTITLAGRTVSVGMTYLSGAIVEVKAGAKLQVDVSAEIDLPLSGLLVGNSAGVAVSALPLTTNGELPIGGSGGPAAGVITGSGGITVTLGSHTIALSLTNPSGISWTDVTSATQTLAINNGYITDRSGGVVYTLPSTASLGDVIMIMGKLGLATITPNANQQILNGMDSGTVGVTGTAVATDLGDCVTFRCITAGSSTVWRMQNWVGNWTLN